MQDYSTHADVSTHEKPVGSIVKQILLQIIARTQDPLEQEDRINIALQEGAISYREAWELRQ